MPDTITPVDPADMSTVNTLVQQLNLLLSDLLSASRATSDPAKLIQVNNEMMGIKAMIDTATQAQAASDDALFAQATGSLKTQAGMLTDMESQISKIVSDVATAGRIVGYIAQAISLIGKL